MLNSEGASVLSTRELPIGNKNPHNNPTTGIGNHWDDLNTEWFMTNDIIRETNEGSSGFSLPSPIKAQYIPNEMIGFGLQENLPPQGNIDELLAFMPL